MADVENHELRNHPEHPSDYRNSGRGEFTQTATEAAIKAITQGASPDPDANFRQALFSSTGEGDGKLLWEWVRLFSPVQLNSIVMFASFYMHQIEPDFARETIQLLYNYHHGTVDHIAAIDALSQAISEARKRPW